MIEVRGHTHTDDLSTAIKKLMDFDFSEIEPVMIEDWTEDFSELLQWIRKTQEICREAQTFQPSDFPEFISNTIIEQIHIIFQTIHKLTDERAWSGDLQERVAEVSNYTNTIYECYQNISTNLMSAIGYLGVTKNLSTHIGQVYERVEKAQEALQTAEDTVREAGLSRHAKFFNENANNHKRSARIWLIVTVLLGLIGFFYILIWPPVMYELLHSYDLLVAGEVSTSDKSINSPKSENSSNSPVRSLNLPKLDPYEAVRTIAGKVIVITLLFYGLRITSRNYQAHRHNEIINRHRALSLSTCEAFIFAAKDPDLQQAVIRRTTECIFYMAPTGYLAKEPDAAPQPTQIFDTVKNFIPSEASKV